MGRKKMKFAGILLCVFLMIGMAGCGSKDGDKEEVVLNIAYQYGLAYAPLVVAKQQKTIEAAYKELTGKEITVNWIQMSSGADINTGIAAGELNVGFMGVGPAITGVAKKVGYKIFTNLSGQEHGLMVNKDAYQELASFIDSGEQIAVVNIGSIQHIMLAMALADEGLDPHALDSNLIAMKHPDGMASVVSGSLVGHVTSSPYIYMEKEEAGLHEIDAVAKAWTSENSFIVGVASEALYKGDPYAYKALVAGMESAIEFVDNNREATAEMTYELDGNSLEKETEYLKKGFYSSKTHGVLKMAEFMYENGFIDTDPGDFGEIAFENVEGD